MDVTINPYVLRAQAAARAAAKASAVVASVAEREDSSPVQLPAPQPRERVIGIG